MERKGGGGTRSKTKTINGEFTPNRVALPGFNESTAD